MTIAYLTLAFLAALGFYLASPHQRLVSGLRQARTLRWAGGLCAALALLAAAAELGAWPGFFAVATAMMLPAVLLPYLDAWRQARQAASGERSRVG